MEENSDNHNEPSENLTDYDSDGDERDETYLPRQRKMHFDSSPPVRTIPSIVSVKKKRHYSYKLRSARTKNISPRRKQWASILCQNDNSIRSMTCCSTLKCFETVNICHLRETMAILFSSSLSSRRTSLAHMYTSSGTFCFDGKSVCTTFLTKAFRFSSDLQTSTKIALSSSSHVEQNVRDEGMISAIDENPIRSESSDIVEEFNNSIRKDAIVTFLTRLSHSTADLMPDNKERHLPFVNKVAVFNRFKMDFYRLYPCTSCPTESYFYSVWKSECSDIKVRKVSRFTKCGTCESLRAEILKATSRNMNTEHLLAQKAAHLKFVDTERREYKSKVELSKLRPREYMSIVVDGADQSAYTLPHFMCAVKEQRGLGLKLHLIGLLDHGMNRLSLYTMTDEHKKGANHVIEVIHRYVNDKSKEEPLPRKLFLQLDNCWRENKNKFMMSYLEFLVLCSVFDIIEVSFLPIGHTHCDIDQAFSSTSNRLRTHDAVTLSDMHTELSHCYNELTTVTHLEQVANFSGLCDEVNCCTNVEGITRFRFFRFSCSQDQVSENDGMRRTCICHVRHRATDEWEDLQRYTNSVASFLSFKPDLRQTPPEEIECPPDEQKFTARLESENVRIGSEAKVNCLVALRNKVFRSRSLNFHWDMNTIIESNSANLPTELLLEEMNLGGEDIFTPDVHLGSSSNLHYEVDSFVGVLGDNGGLSVEFWIGQVTDVIKHNSGGVRGLQVRWFEFYGEGNIYDARYRPCMLINKSTKRKDVPWMNVISADSVIVNFISLTSQRRIPIIVASHIRDRLAEVNTKKNSRGN